MLAGSVQRHGPTFAPSPTTHTLKVPKHKAGEFGHCSNRSAKKWVGVIFQHKGCTWQLHHLATDSLSWPASLALGGGCQGVRTRLFRFRVRAGGGGAGRLGHWAGHGPGVWVNEQSKEWSQVPMTLHP